MTNPWNKEGRTANGKQFSNTPQKGAGYLFSILLLKRMKSSIIRRPFCRLPYLLRPNRPQRRPVVMALFQLRHKLAQFPFFCAVLITVGVCDMDIPVVQILCNQDKMSVIRKGALSHEGNQDMSAVQQ